MDLRHVAKLYDDGLRGFPLASNTTKAPERGLILSDVSYSKKETVEFAAQDRLAWHLSKSNLFVIDWDRLEDKRRDAEMMKWMRKVKSNFVRTQTGGAHFYYRISDPLSLREYTNQHLSGCDIKFYGNSYVKAYDYPEHFVIPTVTTAEVRNVIMALFGRDLGRRSEVRINNLNRQPEVTPYEVAVILKNINPDESYSVWGSVACAVKSLIQTSGKCMFVDWSSTGEKFVSREDVERTYDDAQEFVGDALRFLNNLKTMSLYDNVMAELESKPEGEGNA